MPPELTCIHTGAFEYLGFRTHPSVITVEIYATADRRAAVVCLVDGPANTGTSTINAAQDVAQAVQQALLAQLVPDAEVRWLDVQTTLYAGDECPRYAWLTFADPWKLRAPQWTYVSADAIGALLGASDARQPQSARP
ncbi:hypothetical protein [Deinococcus soli (ex Cha et al. 2016)]|uniref:Uncharacterized protein n=2 Tax=Deinococcus soli (ex Cha et al. 2016) TaxID=1309411 RepID=A0ACC6KFV8_9DEIO|nr:hypothetical protein [Deinococcus soli (ex Cha et al. 2016)]MDR6218382.1 hypothetical protein [Deinococcus soli (ex Cha et al. 2016)]MDR6329122.1 hypothetical protein [Deinococcus soli (ex Cha et al. 2016)]MDR6751395.1 hypothetical protein [Deinococcus soli (ex Cha et al. 2016)]